MLQSRMRELAHESPPGEKFMKRKLYSTYDDRKLTEELKTMSNHVVNIY